MDWILSGLVSFVFFGAGISFLYSFLESIQKPPKNTVLVFILFLTGSILLRYGWYFDPGKFDFPYLFLFLHTSVTLVGPLVYVYIGSRLQREEEGVGGILKLIRRYWIHFIPTFCFAVAELVYFSQSPSSLREAILKDSSEFRWDWIHLATLAATVQVSVYSLFCLYTYHKVSRKYEIYELRLVWVLLLLPVIANSLIGPAYFLKSDLLFAIGACCITGIVILLFVLKEIHPNFFHEMSEVIQNAKYQNTTLSSEEIKAANARLNRLMEDESFFKDSELRLGDLAVGLGLTSHQTSRYLNEIHGETFYELVNRYRIGEACKLLLSDPKKPVLEIGFEVGFNSKSAFNSQFVKVTGVSPALYRKNGKTGEFESKN